MKVIIPVAGLGSRLRPHTYTQPKALLPVAGKPIIGHIVDQAIAAGGNRFVFITGYLGEQIESYLHQHYQVPMEFRQQERMLGLGHAVLTGLDPDDVDLLIILGDTIVDGDLKPIVTAGRSVIAVKEVADARKFGVVELNAGRVTRLIEKSPEPPSNLAIVGVYYIREGARLGEAIKEVIERGITVKGEYQLTDALQLLLEQGIEIVVHPIEGWYDCGKPQALLETNRFLFDRDGGFNDDIRLTDSHIVPPVHLAKGVQIERSIIGPYVSIGENCIVRDAVIRDAIIAESSHIEAAVLAHSIIGRRTRISGQRHELNLGTSSEISL